MSDGGSTLPSPKSLMVPRFHLKTHFKAATSIFLQHKGSLEPTPGELEKQLMLGEHSAKKSLEMS